RRSVQLAHDGIPEAGPRYLLRNDPLTKGKELFGSHCATCHTCRECRNPAPTASDLSDFGGKESIKEFLKNPDEPRFFGHMPQLKGKGKMQELKGKHAGLKDLDALAYFLSTHPRTKPDAGAPPKPDSNGLDSQFSDLERGFSAFKANCSKCHNIDKVADEGDGSGPN